VTVAVCGALTLSIISCEFEAGRRIGPGAGRGDRRPHAV